MTNSTFQAMPTSLASYPAKKGPMRKGSAGRRVPTSGDTTSGGVILREYMPVMVV
jgi:hypothetical protein